MFRGESYSELILFWPPSGGAANCSSERSIPASSSLLLRACACVCVLPQPDSTAEAAFSQGKKKERLRSLSLVPLSVSLAPVVKRAGTVRPSDSSSLSKLPFPLFAARSSHFSTFFGGLVLEGYWTRGSNGISCGCLLSFS